MLDKDRKEFIYWYREEYERIRAAFAEVRMTVVTNRQHDLCRVFWRSHGCDLKRGHIGEHVCNCGDRPKRTDEGGWVDRLYGEDVHNDSEIRRS